MIRNYVLRKANTKLRYLFMIRLDDLGQLENSVDQFLFVGLTR